MRLSSSAGLCAAFLMTCCSTGRSNIVIDFSALPSAQGWTYNTVGNSVPETSVFSLNAGVLTQNTIEIGFAAAPGANYYAYENVFGSLADPSVPFQLSMSARVLQEEGVPGWAPGGFRIGIFTGQEGYLIGIGTNRIVDSLDQVLSTSIDNTIFHDYRLDVLPGVGYEFFIDGSLIATGLPDLGLTTNRLILGDFTGGHNARAQVTSYAFVQSVVPEPSTLVSAALGLVALAGYAGCRRGRAAKW